MLINLKFLILDQSHPNIKMVENQRMVIQEFNWLHIIVGSNLYFMLIDYEILLSLLLWNNLIKNPSFFTNTKFNYFIPMYKGFIEKFYKES